MELLLTIIMSICGAEKYSCHDFFVNCAVDKQGKIEQTKVQECKARYNNGEHYKYDKMEQAAI